ncbi:MAG: carbonic anhydrase [Thermoanaerobaculia bacterium]|jgi:carbonic anhydrase|nr:carbonic anhydrase [Thermoanaerobaculia bacterium]
MRRSISILVFFFVTVPLFAQTSFPAPWPKPLAPEAYWQTLMTGNATYMAGALPYTGLQAQRDANVAGQNPPVTVFSCADSRVPPELIFGRGIGDLFVVRVAGNVAGPFDIASIEYAIAHDWTRLIVVMGHEDCGAVKAALDPEDPPTPSLVALVQRIRESFIGWPMWSGSDKTERAIKANARSSAAYLLAHSAVIRKAVLDHKVGLIVAYYNLKSGKVEEVP